MSIMIITVHIVFVIIVKSLAVGAAVFFFKVGVEVFLGENAYKDLVALTSDRSFNTWVRKAHDKISCQSSDMMLAHPCQQTCQLLRRHHLLMQVPMLRPPNQNVTT